MAATDAASDARNTTSESLTLTTEMRRLLEAAAARILPQDEWPGATEAGVIGYIEWLCAQPRFAERRSLLARGAELIDSLALAMAGRPFVECPAPQQDAILDRLQSIPHRTAQRAFRLIVNMTIAGYVSDPAYGGNRDGVMWRLLRFSPDPTA